MCRFLSSNLVLLIVLLIAFVVHAETVQIKSQGISDAMFGAHEKAFADAKKKALEKYISGLKSQSEANRLILIKQELIENIDEYVKEPVELASEDRNGKHIITIQAMIDVTNLNNIVEKSFAKDRKKAGVKKKQVAFVFVAREIETVTAVNDHNINESTDNAMASRDESNDNSTKGRSKVNASKQSTQNNEDDTALADEITTSKDGKSRLAQKSKNDTSGNSSSQGSSSSDKNLRSSNNSNNTETADAQIDENAVANLDKNTDEDSRGNIKYQGKYRGKIATSNNRQEDAQLNENNDQSHRNNDEFTASDASDTNSSQAVKEDQTNKLKQTNNIKEKISQDATSNDANDYDTKAVEDNKNVVRTGNTKYAESKNTTIQHAEDRKYRVIENGTISAQLSEIFTEQGLKVSDSFDAGELLLKLQKAKSVNQIRPADLKQAIETAKAEGTDFLCIGTLDVDREMIDKATGNCQRYVLVNANIYDLTKNKLEKAGVVGNLNFSGLGETPEVAKNNALSNAVKEAGVKLVSQIRNHMLEDDE